MAFLSFLMDHFKAVAFAEAGEFDTAVEMMEQMPSLKERISKEAKPSSLELTWAAAAFAEHGEFDTARELIKAPATDSDDEVSITDRRLDVLAEKPLYHAKAAAFAEAGEMDHAREILDIHEHTRPKILLIGYEADFPLKAAERAIQLAASKGYELIAVNVNIATSSSPDNEQTKALRGHIMERVAQSAGKTIEEMARASGIRCVHLVEFGDSEEVIKKLCSSIPGIEFVLTEREPTASEKQVVDIPVVYALAPAVVLEKIHSAIK